MREAGLVGRCPRRFRRTTISDRTMHVQDLVQRQFRPSVPHQLWCADLSYSRTWEGWLYLAVIVDAYARKVVGRALADHMRTELATAALQMALTSRRPPEGLVCHADRGRQSTSSTYGEILGRSGARPSVGRPGTCWDSENRGWMAPNPDLTRAETDLRVLALTRRSEIRAPSSSNQSGT